MAATHHLPAPATLADIEDPVTYDEGVALLARTGHPVAKSTLRRYVREDRIDTVRVRRVDYMSWSDLLDAHYRRTAAKLRASSNWP